MFSVKDDQEWRIFEKNSLINSDSIAPLTQSIKIGNLECKNASFLVGNQN